MGYDISIVKDGEVCYANDGEVVPFTGSNYPVGGSPRLSVCITFNYVGLLRESLGGDGLRDLAGCNVKCTIGKLSDAIKKLSGMDDKPWIEKRRQELRYAIWSRENDPKMGDIVLMLKKDLKDFEDNPGNYWVETPTNVKKAIEGLLWMAEHAPDGSTWEVNG